MFVGGSKLTPVLHRRPPAIPAGQYCPTETTGVLETKLNIAGLAAPRKLEPEIAVVDLAVKLEHFAARYTPAAAFFNMALPAQSTGGVCADGSAVLKC